MPQNPPTPFSVPSPSISPNTKVLCRAIMPATVACVLWPGMEQQPNYTSSQFSKGTPIWHHKYFRNPQLLSCDCLRLSHQNLPFNSSGEMLNRFLFHKTRIRFQLALISMMSQVSLHCQQQQEHTETSLSKHTHQKKFIQAFRFKTSRTHTCVTYTYINTDLTSEEEEEEEEEETLEDKNKCVLKNNIKPQAHISCMFSSSFPPQFVKNETLRNVSYRKTECHRLPRPSPASAKPSSIPWPPEFDLPPDQIQQRDS